ncbi:MAG: DUF2330 domain-containing protein [Deltaproteobacteria bacterium]|nr:DUF2330 domain-containing protein [Deltaproteobacteria bacterium]
MKNTFHNIAFRGLGAAAFCAASAALLTPTAALACGGLFCSNSPVDQNAERILFEVHEPPLGVTAVVEISYTGDPGSFSWIVPVPETPTLDVVPVSTLRLLDAATAPNIIPPPVTCEGGDDDFRAGGIDMEANAPNAADGVVVEDLPQVGAFDPEVISSDSAQAVIDWLNDNGYLITPEMEPFVAQYVDDGYKFLGLKLAADQGVADISPIKFTCPGGEMPLIPIRLTGVSAEPEMGILSFVAGNDRYMPQNFRSLEVNTDQVQFDPATQTSNYYPLVSWLIDQEGGKAFVTEYSDSTTSTQSLVDNAFIGNPADDAESREYLRGMLSEFSTITRMYSRMSGWEMSDDPVFAPTTLGAVSRIHDLSDRPPVEVCGGDTERVACGDTYCGVGSMCATTTDGVDGCVCNENAVARQITAPVGAGRALRQTVTCQETDLNLLSSASIGDPCEGFSCGANGSCMAVNGFPTCGCDQGFAAVVNFSQPRGVSCVAVERVFEPSQLLWEERPAGLGGALCECVSATKTPGGLLALGLLFGFGTLLRPRRRSRQA